jgi:hypothetical protein
MCFNKTVSFLRLHPTSSRRLADPKSANIIPSIRLRTTAHLDATPHEV